jgi:dTDP-4-dehydrorhamnose reductase
MILVTGASGLLGANFIQVAEAHGEDLLALSHETLLRLPRTRAVQADLTDRNAVDTLVSRYAPEWIVHCAALTNVDWCEDHRERAVLVNEAMSRNLARAAEKIGASMIYLSTDSVFDGEKGDYRENDPPRPLNVYAETKLLGEYAVREATGRHLIVRTNIYGWNLQNKLSLAEWMLSRLEDAGSMPAFSDVFFTPVLVNDLSLILLRLMKKDCHGVFHAAGSERCSKYGFACILADVFHLDKSLIRPVSIAEAGLRAKRPRDTSLNCEKTTSILNLTPPGVRSGLVHFKQLRETGYVERLKSYQG